MALVNPTGVEPRSTKGGSAHRPASAIAVSTATRIQGAKMEVYGNGASTSASISASASWSHDTSPLRAASYPACVKYRLLESSLCAAPPIVCS